MENLTDIIHEEVRQNAVCSGCGTRYTRLVLEPIRYSTNKGKTRRLVCGLPTLNGVRVYCTVACSSPGCDRYLTFDTVRGTLNPTVPCDARCTNAKGCSCDCSCRGKNHGKAAA
jgi:hypothetical protein